MTTRASIQHHARRPLWDGDLIPDTAAVEMTMTTSVAEIELSKYRQLVYGVGNPDGALGDLFSIDFTTEIPDPLYHRPKDMGWRAAIAWIRAVWRHRDDLRRIRIMNARLVEIRRQPERPVVTMRFTQEAWDGPRS